MRAEHFPSAQKGKIRLIGILIGAAIPPLLINLAFLFYISLSLSVFLFISFAFWGLAIWTAVEMLNGRKWARWAWITGCAIAAFLFMLMGFWLAYIGWTTYFLIILIPYILTLAYGGLAFTLHRNYHIDAFFERRQDRLIGKIEEMGKE